MTLQELSEKLSSAVVNDPENAIQAEYALRPELIGIPFYEAPLLGCAAANDPLFAQYKANPKAYGPLLRMPEEWLPGAKSILAFFFPYTEPVRKSNVPNINVTSDEWLHARVEGQDYISKICHLVAGWLQEEGYEAVIPADHPELKSNRDPERALRGEPVYISNWSERHAAYAAGLGTFSLSKHIITEKGVCGRFGSIITNAEFPAVQRPYTEPYEYCTFCGCCVPRCPVDAISVEKGKDILICEGYMQETKRIYAPRYGCGKCQLSVPCESGIPKKNG